jgi:hypothetical protein
MNLKLFKFRNFAVCALLMILVGGILNATTVLQPQFSQELLNYTATLSGEALTGGGTCTGCAQGMSVEVTVQLDGKAGKNKKSVSSAQDARR